MFIKIDAMQKLTVSANLRLGDRCIMTNNDNKCERKCTDCKFRAVYVSFFLSFAHLRRPIPSIERILILRFNKSYFVMNGRSIMAHREKERVFIPFVQYPYKL